MDLMVRTVSVSVFLSLLLLVGLRLGLLSSLVETPSSENLWNPAGGARIDNL
jgi:hypothetical protein